MFSPSNRLDYQLFFRTRGALRSFGSNELCLLVCFSNVMVCMAIRNEYASSHMPPFLVAILAIGPFLCLRLLPPNPLRKAVSLWSPMVAVLLLYPPLCHSIDIESNIRKLSFRNSTAKWTVYLVLLTVVLLQTISRLRFQSISKLVDWAPGNKLVFWRRVVLNLCMFATAMMLMSTFQGFAKLASAMLNIMALVIVSFGNLQIPAAVLRIVLGLLGGLKVNDQYKDHEHGNKENLKDMNNLMPSLYIFYWMVLGQGILYTIAGILEIFSFILRRSLARQAGFNGPQGVEYVNLYYAYVFNKCMKGAVLAPEKTSLIAFAVDSLNSDSPKKQLSGLKILHNVLRKEILKTKAISELTTSTKTVACLVNMLGWTSERC